ncbi:hypothetical protein RvY_00478-2, partial [Ramazzottius varieornatus]
MTLAVLLLFLASAAGAPLEAQNIPLLRHVRQAALPSQNSLINPVVFQYTANLPQQSTSANVICTALSGVNPPSGCAYTPSVVDPSTNRVLSCILDCSGISSDFQPSPFLGTFNAVNPPYLTSDFTVDDQSVRDNFVGDSYYLFTPPSTMSPMSTPITTAETITGPMTVVPTVAPTPSQSQIAKCVQLRGPAPAGCVYNGNGEPDPTTLTCGIDCSDGTAELQIAFCTRE